MSFRSVVFHPVCVLIASLAGAIAYAALVRLLFPGGSLFHHYLYVVPIVVPFVAFLFDRAKEARTAGLAVLTIDALVVITSILRARGYVPLVSGHALFLTYAIVRRGSWVTRITAALVMLETVYLKLFMWHDFITPVIGIALAVIALMIVQRLYRSQVAGRDQLSTEVLS
jgi:hypothetical protein